MLTQVASRHCTVDFPTFHVKDEAGRKKDTCTNRSSSSSVYDIYADRLWYSVRVINPQPVSCHVAIVQVYDIHVPGLFCGRQPSPMMKQIARTGQAGLLPA